MTLSLFFPASRSMWPPASERGASKPRGTSPFGLVAAPGSSAGRRPGVSRSRSLIAGSHRVRNTGRKRDHLAGSDPLLSPCIQLEDELALQDHRDLVRLVRVALEPRPRLHLEPREHHALERDGEVRGAGDVRSQPKHVARIAARLAGDPPAHAHRHGGADPSELRQRRDARGDARAVDLLEALARRVLRGSRRQQIDRPRSKERRQDNRPFVQGRADPLAAYVKTYHERAEQSVLPNDLDSNATDQPPLK